MQRLVNGNGLQESFITMLRLTKVRMGEFVGVMGGPNDVANLIECSVNPTFLTVENSSSTFTLLPSDVKS